MRANPMRPAELPLLGSNQDSPDPESAAPFSVGASAAWDAVVFPSGDDSSHTIPHTVSPPRWPNQHARKTACVNGHPFTPDNLLPSAGDRRRCRACRAQYEADRRRRHVGPITRARGGNTPFRQSRPGVVLARGPVDYGVPVTVRCGACGNLFEDVLGEWKPCPHCGSGQRGAA